MLGLCSVLIVDDNADDREFFRRALRNIDTGDYRIAEAVDGPEGLAMVERERFDCLLLDYSLPGSNGIDVLRALRADHPHLAIIMLTGQGDVDIAVQALKEGASDYLTKAPDLAHRLHHAIMMAVDNAANARRAERSQHYMRQMLDHIPAPIFMKDEEYRFIDGNAAFWAFMQGGPEKFLGKTDHDFFPRAIADDWRAAERELFAREASAVRGEQRLEHLNGEEVVVITKKGVFRDMDDRKLLVGVIHDVTEMKAQQRALAASEQSFRQAIERAMNGMALVSPEGRWLKVNSALCQMLGYSKDDLLARDMTSVTHPDDREKDTENLADIWADQHCMRQYEKQFLHRRGHVITVLQSVSAVRGRGGRPDYLVIQMLDLTEARKIDRMKSELISTVSHELRTPLTSIRGSLGLMAGPLATEIGSTGRELIHIATENCERLIVLINEILDIDRIAAGQMRFDCKVHRLTDLVERVIRANGAYADRFGMTIVRGEVPKEWHISVDEGRFVQIMSNLISNAVKFSGDGDRVDIFALEMTDGRIRVCVADHGAGIPQEFRDRIFERFAQADSSTARSRNGSGLGLHISRQLVEAMDGTIGFDSEPGAGTTFWIEFAAVAVPADRAAMASRA